MIEIDPMRHWGHCEVSELYPTDGGPRALGGDLQIQDEVDDRLLDLLASGESRISDLVREASGNGKEMSILDVAQRLMQPHNLQKLRQVAMLHATQRAMVLGQLKLNALVRLAELTREDSSNTTGLESSGVSAEDVRLLETQRKACVDILKIADSLIAPGKLAPKNRPPHDDTPPGMAPATEEQILNALERLGRDWEDEDDSDEDSWDSEQTDSARKNVDAAKRMNPCASPPGARPRALPGISISCLRTIGPPSPVVPTSSAMSRTGDTHEAECCSLKAVRSSLPETSHPP